MDKYLRFILMLVFSVGLYLYGYGQTFSVSDNSGSYPTGEDANPAPGTSGLEVICSSCPSDTKSMRFNVGVEDDGSDPNDVFFDWVVYGGSISNQSGNPTGGNFYASPYSRQYLQTNQEPLTGAWIDVEFDVGLPDTLWVAVRQTGGYDCFEEKWTAYLMVPDTEKPTISIAEDTGEGTWTRSLVAVVSAPAQFELTLGSFDDYVHSTGSNGVFDLAPIPADNCGYDVSPVGALDTFGTIHDGFYSVGSYSFVSTAYDCQGNDSMVTQNLNVYDSASFSLTPPPDSTFLNNDCNPEDADFTGDPTLYDRLIIPTVADWTASAPSFVINFDETPVDGSDCLWTRTGTYTVTYTHNNGHNTFEATCDRTYTYTVDVQGPDVVVNPVNNVYLDASGLGSITTLDVIYTLTDVCTDSASVVLSSLDSSNFDCGNIFADVTVNFTATDACGQESAVSALVTILDEIAPSITCPSNITVVNDVGRCDSTFTPPAPVTSDNCNVDSVYWTMSGMVDSTYDRSNGIEYIGQITFPVGTTTIEYTVKDESENTTTCSFTVTVVDNEQVAEPTWPDDIAHIAWEEAIGFPITLPTPTDNCENVTIYTMSVNGVDYGSVYDLTGYPDIEVDLNREGPGDVNNDTYGEDNVIIFTIGDGTTANKQHTWNIQVDYRPKVEGFGTDPTCHNDSIGNIILTTEVESGDEFLEISTDGTNFVTTGASVSGLGAGIYYFRTGATDVGINSYTTTSDTIQVILYNPDEIILTPELDAVTNETCDELNNGAINATVTYNYGGRTYGIVWTIDGGPYNESPVGTTVLTGLDHAVYVLTVTDSEGCENYEIYTVAIDNGVAPTIIDAPNGTVTLPAVNGLCTFTIPQDHSFDPTAFDGTCTTGLTFTHNYSSAPFDTTLNGAVFDVGITNVIWTATDPSDSVSTVSYDITIEDLQAPAIEDQSDVTIPYCDSIMAIPFPAKLSITDNCGIDSVICNLTGDTNWWSIILANGTETPSDYTFEPINGPVTVRWTVIDVNGNSFYDEYIISFTDYIQTVGFSQANIACKGLDNGEIQIGAIGGTPNYTIEFGSVETRTNVAESDIQIFTGVVPSNYTITITDAASCNLIFDILVTEPDALTLTLDPSPTSNTCFEDNTATVDNGISGGTPPYTYNWSGPTYGYADGHPWQAPPVVVFVDDIDQTGNLATGFYKVVVVDDEGCTDSLEFEIESLDVTAPVLTANVFLETVITKGTSEDLVLDDCIFTVNGELDPDLLEVSDDCGFIVVTNNFNSTSTMDGENLIAGNYTVVWSFNDRSGNESQIIVTYVIEDDEFPKATTPSPIAVDADPATCGAVVFSLSMAEEFLLHGGTLTDNCSFGIDSLRIIRSDNPSYNLYQPFKARSATDADTVYWIITDRAGNDTICKQVVQVVDVTPPLIVPRNAPPDINNPIDIILLGNGKVTLRYNDVALSTTDNCTRLDTFYIDRMDGLGLGDTLYCSDIGTPVPVRLTAIDEAGNPSQIDTWVNAIDRDPPNIVLNSYTVNLDNTGTFDLFVSHVFSGVYNDNCDEDGLNKVALSFTPDLVPLDTASTLQLNCDDIPSITVYVYAEDESGNGKKSPLTMGVADKGAPTFDLVDNSSPVTIELSTNVSNTNNGRVYLDVLDFDPGNNTTDACFPLTVTTYMYPEWIDCSYLGNAVVGLVARDEKGNRDTLDFNIVVEDNTDPVIIVRDTAVTLIASANNTMNRADLFQDLLDNCDNDDLEWGIAATRGTGQGTAVATNVDVGGGVLMNFYEDILFGCTIGGGEGDVTFYLYAKDLSDNITIESLETTVQSDLKITSVELNLCWSGRNFWYPGRFEYSSTGGTPDADGDGVRAEDGYDFAWSARNSPWPGFRCFEGGFFGSTTSTLETPRYRGLNFSGGTERIDLMITDDNGCTSASFFELTDAWFAQASSVFNSEVVNQCVGDTVLYVATDGDSYAWSFANFPANGIDDPTDAYTTSDQTFGVIWETPGLDTISVFITTEDDGDVCNLLQNNIVMVYDTAHPVIVEIDDPDPGLYCPLNEVQFQSNAGTETHTAWSWSFSSNGNALSPIVGSNTLNLEWDVPTPIGATDNGMVKVIATNSYGCTGSDIITDIEIGDSGDPVFDISPPDYPEVANPGDCFGSVTFVLDDSYYSDECGEVDKVEYKTQFTNNGVSVPWSGWTQSSSILDDYAVGQTEVVWRITDKTGNTATDTMIFTITDNQPAYFTIQPGSGFEHATDPGGCTYLHSNATENWDISADDNCAVKKLWVTVAGDPGEYSTLDGYDFQSSLNWVTWHVQDTAMIVSEDTVHYSYPIRLTDEIAPKFKFDLSSQPGDFGDYEFVGGYANEDYFYIFADNEDQLSPVFDITGILSDNCAVGAITVTVTDQNGFSTVYNAPSVSNDTLIYTLNHAFELGESTVEWAYNDATGFYPDTVKQYVVFASQYDFSCDPPLGWLLADTIVCNPGDAEFTFGSPTEVLPTWFETLETRSILTYRATPGYTLLAPDETGCEAERRRQIIMTYVIEIQGDPTDRIIAKGECEQYFEYREDILGPVLTPDFDQDTLVLECGIYVQQDIDDWLDNRAGITAEDGCLPSSIDSWSDFAGLAGNTCGAGSETTVTFSFQDTCGNVSTAKGVIKVDDTTPPAFTDGSWNVYDMPDSIVLPAFASCATGGIPAPPVKDTDFFVQDICGATTYNYTTSSTRNKDGIASNYDDSNYKITRIWTIGDACGNTVVHAQNIDVRDTMAPSWGQALPDPGPIPATCGTIPALPTLWATVTDDCDLSLTKIKQVDIVSSTRSGGANDSTYYNYDITRTWWAEDNTPNRSEFTQIIQVRDDSNPIIDIAALDSIVECDGTGNTVAFNNWLISNGGAKASDPCVDSIYFIWSNNYNIANWVVDGDSINNEEVEVDFTVTDPVGNFSTTTATFKIEDTTAPQISGSLINNPIPYGQLSDLPAPYTTVLEFENVGVMVTDACSPGDDADGLIVNFDSDTINPTGCEFTVWYYYTISDVNTNVSDTIKQRFLIKDGVKPKIEKEFLSVTGCATDPLARTTTLPIAPLDNTNITDNCNTGQWFLDNNTLEYRMVHRTNGAGPWTFGNPISLVFVEGITDVYYRATDENNNRSKDSLIYTVTVRHMPVLGDISDDYGGALFVGSSHHPLQFSTHNYYIVMENAGNLGRGATGWKIYPQGDWTIPVAGTYTLVRSNIGTAISAEITFNGTLTVGDYDLVFTEEAVSGCQAQKGYSFTLGGPFDVDIDDGSDVCPDSSNYILEVGNQVQADGTGTRTTVVYSINFVSPDTYESTWHFNYEIELTNTGTGDDATVESVTFVDNAGSAQLLDSPVGGLPASTATGRIDVSYATTLNTYAITMTVEYNDIHGTEQSIKVALSDISGTGSEIDLDVINGTVSDQNETIHLINNLPLPQNVSGVN